MLYGYIVPVLIIIIIAIGVVVKFSRAKTLRQYTFETVRLSNGFKYNTMPTTRNISPMFDSDPNGASILFEQNDDDKGLIFIRRWIPSGSLKDSAEVLAKRSVH